MKRLRKILKWTFIGVGALLLLAVTAVFVVLRTDWGHRKIVAIALPIANKIFAGTLTVGKLSGSLTSSIDIDDAALTDAEGELVARIAHLHATYSLLPLIRKHVVVTSARIDDAWVRGRYLKNGDLNLADLVKPSDSPPTAAEPSGKPVVVDVEDVTLTGAARFEQERGAKPPVIAAAIVLAGSAKITGGVVDAHVKNLALTTELPLQAELALSGDAHIDGAASSSTGVKLSLKTDGHQLRALVPHVKLQGPFAVELDAKGPLKDLIANIGVKLPGGTLDVKANAQLKSQFVWAAVVSARKLDPGAIVQGVPHGDIHFDAQGHGVDKDGTIALKGLSVDMPGLQVAAHAEATVTLSGKLQGAVTLSARDLSKLRGFGVPDLAGSLDVQAKVDRDDGHVAIDAKVTGDKLAAAGARVGHVDVDVKSLDLRGHAHVLAKTVVAGGQHIDLVALDAEGTKTQLAFGLQTTGPDNLHLLLRGRGTPIYKADGKTLRGANVALERFELAFAKEFWSLQAPVAITYDKKLSVSQLDLKNTREQHLVLAGSYGPDAAVDAHVKTSALDAQPFFALLAPNVHVPATHIDIDASVRGTTKHPQVHARVHGGTAADKVSGLPAIDLDIEGDYDSQKAAAKLQIGSAGQHLNGELFVPADPQKSPVHVALRADKIDLAPILRALRGVAPADPDELSGNLAFTINVEGTLRDPTADIVLNLPHWQYQDYGHNDTHVHAHYEHKLFALHFDTAAATEDHAAGKVVLQLNVPIDAGLFVGHAHVKPRQLINDAKLSGKVTLEKAQLALLPWRLFGLAAPVTGGTLDAEIDLGGSLASPTIDLAAKGADLAPADFHDADVTLSAKYAAKQCKLSTMIDVRKVHLLDVEGAINFDLGRLLTGGAADFKTAPLDVTLTFPPYDLSKLGDEVPQLAGELHGKFAARGTLAGLLAGSGGTSVRGELDVDNLNVGATRYSKFAIVADVASAKLKADINASQVAGGTFRLDVNAPLSFKAIDAALDADKFVVDLTLPQSAPLPRIKGILQSNVRVHVASGDVAMSGGLTYEKGQLAIAGQSRPYEDINLAVNFNGNQISVPKLSLRAATGKASATANVTLNKMALQNANATVDLKGFPVAGGPIAIAVDAQATAQAWQEKDTLHAKVLVKKGSARLPKVADTKGVQPLGDLKDVTFVDHRAKKAQALKAAEAGKTAETLLEVDVPGPFHVVSPDLTAELKAAIKIKMKGGETYVSGSVETTTGSVEILNRRYRIERAHVDLDGSADPNPGLDIRVSRDVTSATITAEVEGTVRKPKLVLLANPAVYSQAEILSMIISGDPAAQDTAAQPLDQQVIGAVSGAIVGRIKDQIAPQLPIDVIKLDVGSTDYTPFSTARLEVGKFLTDSIYVSYAHRFGTQVTLRPVNQNEGSLEYRFLRRYTLQTTFGDEAVGSIDLFWSKRY